MKSLYFTILMLSVAGIATANAADYNVTQTTTTTGVAVEVPVTRKSEVPEYDTLDKSQLGNRRGFVAMNVGGELTQDSAERYGRTFVNEGGNAVPQMRAPQMRASQMRAPQQAQEMQMIEPAAGQSLTTPSVNARSVTLQNDGPDIIVMQDPQPQPQPDVITTYYVVGNTDTGVDMDEVQRLVE